MFYQHAIYPDNTPVNLSEMRNPETGEAPPGAVPYWPWSRKPWTFIAPGDLVQFTVTLDAAFPDATMTAIVHSVLEDHVRCIVHDGETDEGDMWELYPQDLTLICGEPSEFRKQVWAWQWPKAQWRPRYPEETETGDLEIWTDPLPGEAQPPHPGKLSGATEIGPSPKHLNHISDGNSTYGTLCGLDVSAFLEPGKLVHYSPDWPYCQKCLDLDG